jgi:hypothetical protein
MGYPFRLVLKKLEISSQNEKQHVLIWLSGRDEIYVGEATSNEDEDEQLKAIVQATLQAVNKSLTKPIELELIHCRQIFISEIASVVFLVIIQVHTQTAKRLLPGICLYSSYTPEVAAKATLKALNRTISQYF